MTVVLYPGSFDPVHNGHIELIEVASKLYDEVIVAAMRNPQKGEPLFEADFIVKGLRVVSDFESELMQAQMNLAVSGVHTVFIPSATTHSFLASKLIREIARFGGDVSTMVPPAVARRLAERYPA